MASHTWAKDFLRRYPHIKVHQTANLSVTRAMAGNESNICNWLKEYQQVIKTCGIVPPEQIWSGDETGVQNVPKEEKILGEVKKLCTTKCQLTRVRQVQY